jgi:hypothetical protein
MNRQFQQLRVSSSSRPSTSNTVRQLKSPNKVISDTKVNRNDKLTLSQEFFRSSANATGSTSTGDDFLRGHRPLTAGDSISNRDERHSYKSVSQGYRSKYLISHNAQKASVSEKSTRSGRYDKLVTLKQSRINIDNEQS